MRSAPQRPSSLEWQSPRGAVFRKEIAVDEDFVFTVTQSVENTSDAALRLAPFGLVARVGEPETIGMWLLHEGVVRASDGQIQEIDYDDMPGQPFVQREAGNVEQIDVQNNGWIGFTSKYWMTALLPEPGMGFESVSKYVPRNDTYQVEMRLPAHDVAPGETLSITSHVFAGAKEYQAIRDYQRAGFLQFVDSIDWGWLFFLTKPMFWVLHELNKLIGNMGWAIIGLTFVVKAALFPLAYKSYVSMARMKELQPEMEKLKEKHGDDRQAMQADMMKLYREKNANPAAGCLPLLVQIPIFFSLYKVIFVTLALRHEPFIGWLRDLSAPDPTSWINLFGLMPWAAPGPESFFALFSIGVWPIAFGVSMWLPAKAEPGTARSHTADDLCVAALDFHVHAWPVCLGADRLLGGKQPDYLCAAISDHAQPGDKTRHSGQYPIGVSAQGRGLERCVPSASLHVPNSRGRTAYPGFSDLSACPRPR